MKMFNEAGQAVYFNRVMKNGREQFVVKALDGQHIMGRDRQKHSSRTVHRAAPGGGVPPAGWVSVQGLKGSG